MNEQKDTFSAVINSNFKAIEYCIDKFLLLPALILIYSTIDFMAFLSMPDDQDENTKKDFINWVDNYLLKSFPVSCRGIDLYAARCSILHSHTSSSSLSRTGKARQIFYTYGNQPTENLANLIDLVEQDYPHIKPIPIHISDLYKALSDGIFYYFQEVENNPTLQKAYNKRIKNVMKRLPVS